MQQTLNMLRTLQQNNSLTTDEELNGHFDWNATPMAPLGNRAAAFIAPDNCDTHAPHAIEACVTSMAPQHYQLLKVCIPTTRGYCIIGIYRFLPSYWSVPTVSKHKNSIVVATDLLKYFQQFVPTTAEEKWKYITAIKKLTAVIKNHPTQETQGALRVDETPTTTLVPR